jgi:phage terminase large subunit-like protein
VSLDLSCPDWAARLMSGRVPFRDLVHTSPDGDRAVAVFNKLRLADVPGTPTMADAGGDWFRDIVRALFGSMDPATRQRAIRELFLLVPKKNSKTSNGALLMLTALLLNQRPNATLIMTAPVQDVAQLAFDAAAGAVALDEVLSKKLHVREHLKTIVHRETKAELQIMTFDPSVLTGQKPVAALIDELHVVSKMSKASSALRQLRGGMLPYPEAFLAFITTQSEEAPAGVFKDELDKARDIRDGKREGAMLPVLYEFPREMQRARDQWEDPANWAAVTPNAGRSIQINRLVEEHAVAKQTSEAELRAWASQHLNIEIGLALMSNSWAGANFWTAQADKQITLDALFARCSVLVVAIDGGGNDDLYGATVLGRDSKTNDLLSWSHAWALPIVLERRMEIAPRLLDFQKQGDLTIVSKIEDACADVVAIVKRADEAGLLGSLQEGKKRAIGVDAACIKQTLDALNAAGYPDSQIIAVSQGWRLTSAIKSTELYLSSETLRHADQPLMDWCVGNGRVEPKGNAVLITKQASGSAKIDPLMSLFTAVDVMAQNPQAGSSDVFTAHDLLVIG